MLRAARRLVRRVRYRQPICPRCKINRKTERSDGRLRSWCRDCENKQKHEYNHSPAGKANTRRYYERHCRPTWTPRDCFWCATPMPLTKGRRPGEDTYCSDDCRRLGANQKRSLRLVNRV